MSDIAKRQTSASQLALYHPALENHLRSTPPGYPHNASVVSGALRAPRHIAGAAYGHCDIPQRIRPLTARHPPCITTSHGTCAGFGKWVQLPVASIWMSQALVHSALRAQQHTHRLARGAAAVEFVGSDLHVRLLALAEVAQPPAAAAARVARDGGAPLRLQGQSPPHRSRGRQSPTSWSAGRRSYSNP